MKMKQVLIATTNKDKFRAVSRVFKSTIFPSDEYELQKLTPEMNLPDEKESGSNIERAKAKAFNAFEHLKEYNFDYYVGLDDALVIKGRIEPNIKEYLNKILYENYLEDGEEYSFNRAYCILDKDGNIYETNASIPYLYHPLKEDYKLEEFTYPLSKVAYPIGDNRPVSEFNDEEATNYYLKYVKNNILSLNIKNTN
jgi:hypothetical protein